MKKTEDTPIHAVLSPDGSIRIPESLAAQIRQNGAQKIVVELLVKEDGQSVSGEIARIAETQRLEPQYVAMLLEAEGMASQNPELARRLADLGRNIAGQDSRPGQQ